MKVADVMQKKVDSVTVNSKVKEVARMIFGSRINGVPVLKDKKVVGFITERDILAKFYPSMEEYMEDPVHSRDFEGMEKKITEILRIPAEKIMSKNPTVIKGEAPLLKAYSLMTARKIGRLPVVDDEGKLIGIIAKGDIFNYLVGSNIPLRAEEEFYDWVTKHYDLYINWEARLKNEIPDLVDILKKEKIENVLDIASSTGEHAIALAKQGFETFGIEASGLMHKRAEEKKSRQPQAVKERIHFLRGMYKDSMAELPVNLGAALFMGNAFAHVAYTEKNILSNVAKVLDPKKGMMIFQVVNFDLKLEKHHGLKEFIIRKIPSPMNGEYAYISFYSKDKGNNLQSNLAILDCIVGKWMLHGLNSTLIKHITLPSLRDELKKVGFTKFEAYGSSHNKSLFAEKFDPEKSEWMIIVARR